jgi:hypothetical protein
LSRTTPVPAIILLKRNTSPAELPLPAEIPGHRLHLHENNKRTAKAFFLVLYT